MSDTYDANEQDRSDAFDETHTTEDAAEFTTFEEMPDVLDTTQALGDTRDIEARDADEFDEDAMDDEDLDDDEDLNEDLQDLLEDQPEDNGEYTDNDRDEADGVTELSGDEAELVYTDDVDGVEDVTDQDATAYESSTVSDEDLKELGYSDAQGHASATDTSGHAGEAPQGTGKSADDVPDDSHPRQEDLLDEGVEETFPASDPVSVKHIT